MSTAEESVTLDNGGFTALELNSRTLNTKNSFLKKNGTRFVNGHTFLDLFKLFSILYFYFFFLMLYLLCVCVCTSRSPPRPSPGGLHYSDEDICNNYNGAVLTESTTLTEKPTEVSESEVPLSHSLSICLSLKVKDFIGLTGKRPVLLWSVLWCEQLQPKIGGCCSRWSAL